MELAAFHKFVDGDFLPPTNYTVYVIKAHRHAIGTVVTRLYSQIVMFVALMMAVDYNVLPPHTALTHWFVM